METLTLRPAASRFPTRDTAFVFNTLPREERLRWLRRLDRVTPCGALLVLNILELSQPCEGLYSLTSAELTAYFASGYEILPLACVSCAQGTEYRFLLKKHNSLDPTLIADSLRGLRHA